MWHDGLSYAFVGDAKYKRVVNEQVPNADLYQMLAYSTALDLPGGMLIYAKGEAEPVVHDVRNASKSLVVSSIDLSGSLDEILHRIEELATEVRALREKARDIKSRRSLSPP